jgi:hypothetical protein
VPSLRQSVHEVMDKALEGTETSNYELEFETKSKEIRYLLVNATTRRDAEYNITGVVGVVSISHSFRCCAALFFHFLTCLHHLGA